MSQRVIVVVDDEPDLADLMAMDLEGLGYKTKTFNDGESAMNFISNNHIDAIVTDIQMPKTNGLDLIKMIRARDAEIPIVAVSGFNDLNQEVQAQNVYKILAKPLEITEVAPCIDEALKKVG